MDTTVSNRSEESSKTTKEKAVQTRGLYSFFGVVVRKKVEPHYFFRMLRSTLQSSMKTATLTQPNPI